MVGFTPGRTTESNVLKNRTKQTKNARRTVQLGARPSTTITALVCSSAGQNVVELADGPQNDSGKLIVLAGVGLGERLRRDAAGVNQIY